MRTALIALTLLGAAAVVLVALMEAQPSSLEPGGDSHSANAGDARAPARPEELVHDLTDEPDATHSTNAASDGFAGRFLAARLVVEGVVTGREVLDAITPHAGVDFESAKVRERFLTTRFVLDPLRDDVSGILGEDVLMQVREKGYEVEIRSDRLWIMETPRADD